jgi:phosphate transport system substrate-binding protein
VAGTNLDFQAASISPASLKLCVVIAYSITSVVISILEGGARLKKKFFLFTVLIAVAALLTTMPANCKDPGANISIHLRGSGTVMGLIQQCAESYMSQNPNVIISVSGGGTDRGIKSLIDGTSQIAMASSEINGELSLLAGQRNVKLVKHVIAYDAIVPYVNTGNPVSNLTVEQLRKIYTSQITNWGKAGGKDAPIIITTRNLDSGTYEGWKLLVIGEKAVLSPHAKPMESKPMKRFIQANPNGIGYSAFSYIDKTVKPLTVNGVAAGKETIKSGKYPIKRELILYIKDDASTEIIKFIEYINEVTPKIAEKAGVFPLN